MAKSKNIMLPSTKGRDWNLPDKRGTWTEVRTAADARKTMKSTPSARYASQGDNKAIKSKVKQTTKRLNKGK